METQRFLAVGEIASNLTVPVGAVGSIGTPLMLTNHSRSWDTEVVKPKTNEATESGDYDKLYKSLSDYKLTLTEFYAHIHSEKYSLSEQEAASLMAAYTDKRFPIHTRESVVSGFAEEWAAMQEVLKRPRIEPMTDEIRKQYRISDEEFEKSGLADNDVWENALFFSRLAPWQLSFLEEKSPNVYNRLYDNYSYCLSVAEGWSTEKNDSANKQKVFENELLDMMTMGLYNIGFQISDREEYIKTELLKKDRQASVLGGQFLGLVGSFKIGAGLSQPKIGVPGGVKVPKKLPKLPRLSRVKETPKATTKVPKTPVASGGRTRYKLEKISPGREGKRFKVVEGRSRGLGSGEMGNKEYEKIEVIDSKNRALTEIDKIDTNADKIIEDKNASKLYMKNPAVPQTEQMWADKKIYQKTVNRIDSINSGVGARPATGGSSTVPSLSDLQGIRNYEFKINADTPALRNAVQESIYKLQNKYPGYHFSVQFGGE